MPAIEMEQILVVPTQLFHELGHFQGFSTDVDRYVPRVLDPDVTEYRSRGEMEQDPSFKQLIPYVIFSISNGRWTSVVSIYPRIGAGRSSPTCQEKRGNWRSHFDLGFGHAVGLRARNAA